MPTNPPINESVTASTRNCTRMSLRRAPTAMRRPISRVRSVTETSMMFMMPIPPTSSAIDATAESSSVRMRWLAARASVISERLRTRKSSSSPGPMRWRSRSRGVDGLFGFGHPVGAHGLDHDDADRVRPGAGARPEDAFARGGDGDQDNVVLILPERVLPLRVASTPMTSKGTFLMRMVSPTGLRSTKQVVHDGLTHEGNLSGRPPHVLRTEGRGLRARPTRAGQNTPAWCPAWSPTN